MKSRTRRLQAVLGASLACLLLSSPASAVRTPDWVSDAPAWASNAGPIVFDAVVLRPLGLIATVIGAGFFVPAAIITAPTGSAGVGDAWGRFVEHQGDYTFKRKLGDF